MPIQTLLRAISTQQTISVYFAGGVKLSEFLIYISSYILCNEDIINGLEVSCKCLAIVSL